MSDLLALLGFGQVLVQLVDLLVVGFERLAVLCHDRAEINDAFVGRGQRIELLRGELVRRSQR